MTNKTTVKIYVALLEEGTPTYKETSAEVIGDGLYKLLPSANYDPEDEIWGFVPGTIVRGVNKAFESGDALAAVRVPVPRVEILRHYPDKKTASIEVPFRVGSKVGTKTVEALDLKNGFYKLLPNEFGSMDGLEFEFECGSVVYAVVDNKTGKKTAFVQLREDRLDGEFAGYLRQKVRMGESPD
ncbi:MAG: hypothetical protein EBQ96_06205 [Proteobacteria bacterium]|nr:hypothetical protein [Pseudomonadota bacterium]